MAPRRTIQTGMGRVRSRATPGLALVALSAVLSGCFTGERGSLAAPVPEIADPAVDAVVQRLEGASTEEFSATFTIFTKLASEVMPVTEAVVSRTGVDDRSITFGDIRFLDTPGTERTCDLSTGSCEPSFDEARISNLLVNHDFYGMSPAARLRQDAQTMISAGIASTRTVAGRSAICVQVDFVRGSNVYCALDNGLLAYQNTADLEINLVSIVVGADPERFTTSTIAPG